MLTVKNATYKVKDRTLLDDVTITFQPGKLHLIVGPNGAGKSTLVKLICNQLSLQNGSICYDDKPVHAIPISLLAKFRAVLSQNIELAFPLTVSEVVLMGRYPHFNSVPNALDKKACEEAMLFFDVLELADQNYMTLSGGEKQRVHFARVISQIWFPIEGQCRYLILDEPLAFLDIRYQFHFMNKLVELSKRSDITVIGVVHDLNLVSRFADQIILLHQGKLIASGSKEEVFTKATIKAAYQLEPVIYTKDDHTYLFFE
jgi:iron complex transport system ATP-binding protein